MGIPFKYNPLTFFQMDSIFRWNSCKEWTERHSALLVEPYASAPWPGRQFIQAYLPDWIQCFLRDMWVMVSEHASLCVLYQIQNTAHNLSFSRTVPVVSPVALLPTAGV